MGFISMTSAPPLPAALPAVPRTESRGLAFVIGLMRAHTRVTRNQSHRGSFATSSRHSSRPTGMTVLLTGAGGFLGVRQRVLAPPGESLGTPSHGEVDVCCAELAAREALEATVEGVDRAPGDVRSPPVPGADGR